MGMVRKHREIKNKLNEGGAGGDGPNRVQSITCVP